jgi:hypothetical protein
VTLCSLDAGSRQVRSCAEVALEARADLTIVGGKIVFQRAK